MLVDLTTCRDDDTCGLPNQGIWAISGDIDDDHSVPSGDLSPDLVRMEVRMPEELPNGQVTVTYRSKEGEMSEYALNTLRQVLEGSVWLVIWAFVDSKDALGMRTTNNTWNVAGKYGAYGELFFFFRMKKEPNVEFGYSLDTPFVKYGFTPFFDRDSKFQQDARLWTRPSPRPSLVMRMDERR